MFAVEKHGSTNPKETAELLREIEQSLKDVKANGLAGDKFQLLKGSGYSPKETAETTRRLELIVETLNSITGELSTENCDRATLDIYLNTVQSAFSDELDNFPRKRPTHDTKLHAFLIHYGQRLAKHCLEQAVPRDLELGEIDDELMMDQMVTLDANRRLGQNDFRVLDDAKYFSLYVKKDSRNRKVDMPFLEMLEASKSWKYSSCEGNTRKACKAVVYHVESFCNSLKHERENELMLRLYNFARWLGIAEAQKLNHSIRFQKLNEYYRICLPLQPWDAEKKFCGKY